MSDGLIEQAQRVGTRVAALRLSMVARSIEQRRHVGRTRVDLHVEFSTKDSRESFSGTGTDISVGGMFIETDHVASFGADILLRVAFPGHVEPLVVPATVRWTCPNGMGVQFRLLGALVTHAITEILLANGGRRSS